MCLAKKIPVIWANKNIFLNLLLTIFFSKFVLGNWENWKNTDVFGFQTSESVEEHNYHKNQVYETKEDIMKKSSVESSKVLKFLSCLGIVWSMNGLKSNRIIVKSGSGDNTIWAKAK